MTSTALPYFASSTTRTRWPMDPAECRCEDCERLDRDEIQYHRENRHRLAPRLIAELQRLERKWPDA